MPSTAGHEYAERLRRLDASAWRRRLNVQAPYRWNIRRLKLGRTLDVGCGLGRNLAYLATGSVGVDHNPDSIAVAQSRGLQAHLVEHFLSSPDSANASFDSILIAHVIEHLTVEEAQTLLVTYLPFLKSDGRVCFITPQERGYLTDETHVRFVDFEGLVELSRSVQLRAERQFSFPFPRPVGKVFPYNEFVVLARKA
jgi:2-polyprenyl-3-methyl-5-hydroxy-6-metoxy-1,4-benzoquinol methylase